jgi:uncharacterized protein YpmB
MFTTRITKAIGGNSDLNTSQSFVFQGATQESEQVMLMVLISASGEDIFTKIRNIGFSTEQYFFSSEFPLTEKLQKTMDYLLEQTALIEHKNILLAVLKDEALYMLSAGSDQVLLEREQKTRSLINQGDNQLISGFIQSGDKVLFLSPRFAREGEQFPIWDEYFIQRLLLSDQEVLEEEIENYLQQLGKPEPIAVIVLSAQPIITQREPITDWTEERKTPTEDEGEESIRRIDMRESSEPPQRKISLPKLSIPKIPLRLKRSISKVVFPLTFKKLGILATILLIILISSGAFFYQVQQKNQKQNELKTALNSARENLAQADQLKESNRDQSRQFLQTAKTSLQKALSIDAENSETKALSEQLAQTEGIILRSKQLNNWQTFLSLDLVRPGFQTKKMSYSVGKLLMLDENQKSLIQIEIETKNTQLIAGQTQLGDAQFASLNGDFAFIHSSDKGLLRVDTPTRQITTVAKTDTEWGQIVDVVGFSSNVYLLDARGNQIWKYVPAGSGYSEKQIYLKDNQSLDFSNAKQLFIDFSVWVLKDTPEIIRFTAGSRDFYSIGGLDTPLTQVESIFAPEDEDILFILDPSNKRIITTKKNGEYISQYTADIFAGATDLFYDEETKILYVLENNKIQQTSL